MKYFLFVTLLIGSCSNLKAQFSTFEATTFHQDINEYEIGLLEQMTWVIGGITYRYGDAPVSVPVNSRKVDTMLYQRALDQPWESILFKVAEERGYVFNANTCCGGFDVRPKEAGVGTYRRQQTINFHVIGQKEGQQILAKHSDAGSFVISGSCKLDAISPSAMSNDIYLFSLVEYTACKDEEEWCDKVVHLISDEEYKYEYFYRTVKVLVSGLYLPLGDWDITLTYDMEMGEFKMH